MTELPADTARAQLAALLAAALDPDTRKIAASADGATPEPTKDLVSLALARVTPGRKANSSRTCEWQIIAAVAKTTPGVADDALEVLLGDVLDAIEGIDWLTWQLAERSLYLPEPDAAGFPAFTITAVCEVQP